MGKFTQEELAQAKTDIDNHLEEMQKNLHEAQAVADKYGLKFRTSLSLPKNHSGKLPDDPYGEGYPEMDGTYKGAGSEKDYNSDDENATIKEGYWYWHASSLRC